MGVTVGFTLHQFSEVFKIRDASGLPYILIGGQTVNYWAGRYLASEPQLETLQPFTSEDIDFKGGSKDIKRIASQLGLHATFPAKVQLTALAGSIPIQINGLKSNIEIVRRIPGLSDSVDALAVRVEWEGKAIRVIDPISLLASKLELAATISQEIRQDVAHLKMLQHCVRSFLDEFLQQVENGQIPAKHWLGAVNQVLNLTTNQRARKIASQHHINWPEILPLADIATSRNEKIRRFKEQQLAQGFKKPEPKLKSG